MQADTDQFIADKLRTLSSEQKKRVLDFVSSLTSDRKDIWAKLDERLSGVPDEEFAELPTDASENLNHYLYGSPKK